MKRPSDRETVSVLRYVGRCMGAPCLYTIGGLFYFPVGGRWSLSVSPDDAGRFRLQACDGGRPVATMWCLGADRDRLADLVAGFQAEVQALTN